MLARSRLRAGWLFVLSGLVAAFLTCGPSQNNFWDDDPQKDGGDSDGGAEIDMAERPKERCGPTMACVAGKTCVSGICVPDRGPCCSDEDCQNDTRCTVQSGTGGSCGRCIDYKPGESDPACIGNGFSATEFKAPVDHCHWPLAGETPVSKDVVMTPIVIDLDLDGQPEIVFAPQTLNGPSRLVAIRGSDCTQLYDVDAKLQGFSQLAAADLDGDKRPEIVGLLSSGATASGHRVAVFEGLSGRKLAESGDPFLMSGAFFDCSAPAIADLDGDGKPEIIVGGMVVRWNKATGRLDTVWNELATGASWGTATLVNDLDGDGKPEVVTGTRILDGQTGKDETPSIMNTMFVGGYPAIGDFNKDGAADLVFVQSSGGDQKVMIVDVKNNRYLMEPISIPGGWGGSPTVADFDGDGTPDFGTSGPRYYYVFSLDCLKTPKPAKCRGMLPGILWQTKMKDVSSGGTASSVFDFNGDGRAEVVYRDECWLRVYNGPDGKTVFARPVTSGTALEMPVVADVNNDGHADIVVPSDSIQMDGYCADYNPEPELGIPHTGVTYGLYVLKDLSNRWMPSRPMWNQHTYHITNINDDGTVPASEPANWTLYNNYRQNVQGKIVIPKPQSDATGRGSPTLEVSDCSLRWVLAAEVCNRGAAPIAAKMPATFYKTDPQHDLSGGICTAFTVGEIAPGTCQRITCAWNAPEQGSVDLWLRVNDDGKSGRPQTQCKTRNDTAYLPGSSCRSQG